MVFSAKKTQNWNEHNFLIYLGFEPSIFQYYFIDFTLLWETNEHFSACSKKLIKFPQTTLIISESEENFQLFMIKIHVHSEAITFSP